VTAERLGSLAAAVCVLRQYGDPTDMVVADALGAVLAGRAVSIDSALGITGTRGQRRLATRVRLERRDNLIREAAARFFPGMRTNAQADRLARALARYSDTAWRRDRMVSECPARLVNTLQAYCWELLANNEKVLGAERIKQILRNR
jgi:hypothetical protein